METEKNVRVAINGFGRIGRAFFKLAHTHYSQLDIVAINDLGNVENLAYLLEFDTAQGISHFDIEVGENELIVDGTHIAFIQERDPSKLPWKEMNIDIVVESTGFFTHYDKAKAHLDAGAKHVLISAPGKRDAPEGITVGTILMGVNDYLLEEEEYRITSNGSCTTNATSPLIAILNESIGIKKALLNTTHAYTATQAIVDGPSRGSDFRKGRAAAQNIVPTSTGAAKAVTKAITELEGKFDGIACRVPVVAGSIADVTFLAERETSVEEVNDILRKAAESAKWEGIFAVSEDPIVSSDIVGSTHASIADLPMTRVVDGDFVKVMAWYDNEMGYTNALVRHALRVAEARSLFHE